MLPPFVSRTSCIKYKVLLITSNCFQWIENTTISVWLDGSYTTHLGPSGLLINTYPNQESQGLKKRYGERLWKLCPPTCGKHCHIVSNALEILIDSNLHLRHNCLSRFIIFNVYIVMCWMLSFYFVVILFIVGIVIIRYHALLMLI